MDPDSSFVNFMTLAESVALAPITDFWTSLDVISTLELIGFSLFADVLLFCCLLVSWASAYITIKISLFKYSTTKLQHIRNTTPYTKLDATDQLSITSFDMSIRSLVPASISEKLLPKVGDRKLGSSGGSALLVSKTLPGILRPLSNLHCRKKNKNLSAVIQV